MNPLGTVPDAFLGCREFGHAWQASGHTNIVRRGTKVIEFTRVAVCLRCEASRSQKISVPDFRIVSTSRTYPEHYLLVGRERVHKADVRYEVLTRYLTGS